MGIEQVDALPPGEITQKLCQQQQRELEIIKAIIQTVSGSHSLQATLESALEIVLSVVNSSIGWICLLDEMNACSAFVGFKGICFDHNGGVSTPCLEKCVCGRVRRTGDVVMIRNLSEECPLCKDAQSLSQKIVGHVSVPLFANSRIVGQLNVAFSDQDQAEQIDIELLRTISPQLAVAVENARLWDEVQKKEILRKELLKRVVTAQEEERRRISRELHDEMGQELTSLLIRLQVLEKADDSAKSSEIINGLKQTTSQMLTSIHDLALELRPTVLDDLGLVPALEQYCKSCPGYLGIEVDFSTIGMNDFRLPREIETTLYRIIQESLTNVARHSGAKGASVLIKLNEANIVTIIGDSGVGFEPKENHLGSARNNHLGIYGMQERVSLVGGSFNHRIKARRRNDHLY